MSGRPPFEVGISHTIFQREKLALDVITFPQALQQAGYKTGLFGKWHLGDEEEYLPQKRGFDEVLMHGAGGIGQFGFGDFQTNTENTYFDNVLLHNDTVVKTRGFCTDVFCDAALAWISEQKQAPSPYFAYISLNAPHSPMIAPKKYKQRFLELGAQPDRVVVTGNVKYDLPPPATPLAALRIAELVREADFPPGVFNVVTGLGETAGAALVAHRDVNKITFTGSTSVGKAIARPAAGHASALPRARDESEAELLPLAEGDDRALSGADRHGPLTRRGRRRPRRSSVPSGDEPP